MKMKSIINVTCIYVIFVSTRQRNEKKKIILALTVHSVRQRRRDCELIENLLLTYIFNKHAVLSNRTRERTLTSKKVQLPIIIIILIEIWFDSSRNQGDETIFFAVDTRNSYPNKSQRSSILAHSSFKKKQISIESKIIYDDEEKRIQNIENIFDTY